SGSPAPSDTPRTTTKGTRWAVATRATAALSSSTAIGSAALTASASGSQPNTAPRPGRHLNGFPPNGSLLCPSPPTVTFGCGGTQTSGPGGLGGTGLHRPTAGVAAATA